MRRVQENPTKYLETIKRLIEENKYLNNTNNSLNQSIMKKEKAHRRKEGEWRLKEERKTKMTQESSRKYEEMIRKLTKENEFLKSNNDSLNQTIKKLKPMTVFQNELEQQVKYYKSKYLSVSNMINGMRKEVKQIINLEKSGSEETEVDTSRNCRVCGGNRRMEESIKDKLESLNEEYKIIQKFAVNRVIKNKKSGKV